jgi:hypothetical protein
MHLKLIQSCKRQPRKGLKETRGPSTIDELARINAHLGYAVLVFGRPQGTPWEATL